MYKSTSRNQQKAAGRVVSRRFIIRNYLGKRQARAFFFPVIFHAAQNSLELSQVQKMPYWLIAEVARLGIVDWLERNIKDQRPDTIARLRRSLRDERIIPKKKLRKKK